MKCDGDSFQQGCLSERKVFWQVVRNAGGKHDILGKRSGAAVISARDAQDFTPIAQVYFISPAKGALATINRRVESDAVALGKVLHP
jgi:hypothetical protein